MLLPILWFGLALAAGYPSHEDLLVLERGGCPMFWYNFNGRCYRYISTRFKWANAELHCVSQGANLVSIHSQEEVNFVKNLIKNFDPAEGHTWIGLSDIHKEGSWMWSDGSAFKFSNWRERQPDNYRWREDCGHINYISTGSWNDCPCSKSYPSVCASRIHCK